MTMLQKVVFTLRGLGTCGNRVLYNYLLTSCKMCFDMDHKITFDRCDRSSSTAYFTGNKYITVLVHELLILRYILSPFVNKNIWNTDL